MTSRTRARPAAEWVAIGTLIRVVTTEPDRLDEARRLLTEDLDHLDAACSRFRPDSELVRLSDRPGEPVAVSPLLAAAVAAALRAADETDGDLDPTVGGALVALGYDRDFAQVPADGPTPGWSVRQAPGWRDVDLDERNGRMTLPAGVVLDLGATAKAWQADRSAARIADELGCGVLVSLGGDVAVAGPAPSGGWLVRVQDVTGSPGDPPVGPAAVVAVSSGGLATSSTAARSWRRGGFVLHHIVDPRTGWPAAPVWRTVSVAAPTALAANVASTVAVIRGHAASAWLARTGLPARLVSPEGQVRTIGGWPAEPAPPSTIPERSAVNGINAHNALWYLSRATGVVTLLLFTGVVLLGVLVNRQGRLPGLPRFAVTGLHRSLSLVAVVFLLVHVLTAVFDGYVVIGLPAVVIPLASPYERLWMALGTVALDLWLAVIVTSLLRRHIGRRTWRAVHWLAYAAYPVAVLHSIGSAPDLQSGLLLGLTVASVAAVGLAAGYRLVTTVAAVPRARRASAELVAHQGRTPSRVAS